MNEDSALMPFEDLENDMDATAVERMLDELDAILDPEGDAVAAMSDTAIHGYLTALACAPIERPVDTWFKGLFGDGRAEPTFSDMSIRDRIIAILIAIRDGIRIEIADESYVAIVDIDEQNGDRVEDVTDWCRGFHLALDDHFSEEIENDDELWEIVEPLVYLSDPEGIEEDLPPEDIKELRDQKSNFIEELEECVFDFYDYWHSEEGENSNADAPPTLPWLPVEGIEPDRNAPCPCGSGKRYRKCHGRLI